MRENAGQIGPDGVCCHDPACPRGIPKKEDREAAKHAPVGKLGATRLKNEVLEILRFSC